MTVDKVAIFNTRSDGEGFNISVGVAGASPEMEFYATTPGLAKFVAHTQYDGDLSKTTAHATPMDMATSMARDLLDSNVRRITIAIHRVPVATETEK